MNVSAHMSFKRRRSLWSQSALHCLVMMCSLAILVAPLFAQESDCVQCAGLVKRCQRLRCRHPSRIGPGDHCLFSSQIGVCNRGRSRGRISLRFFGRSEQTAKNIWIPSMYGTYIITPEHLKGDKPIRFLGVPAESQRDAVEYVPQEPAPLPLEPIR